MDKLNLREDQLRTVLCAREFAGVSPSEYTDYTGEDNHEMARAVMAGRLQWSIGQLLDIIREHFDA